ncbi:MAG: PAS domain-containing sensor histidine kinase [bacterium]
MKLINLKTNTLFKKLFALTLLVAVLPLTLSWMYFFYIEKGIAPGTARESSLVFYGLLCLALVLAALGTYYFTKNIVQPITHFIKSATEIARGNFSHKVKVESDDEIGRLAKIFNYMTEELRRLYYMNLNKIINEKNKTETILKNIADGVIVTDATHRIVLINYVAEQWFDLLDKNVVEQPIEKMIPNRRLFKFIRDFKSREKMKYESIEINIKPNQGWKEIVLQARAARILNDKRELMGIVTVLRDITKEKEIDRMKTELVSLVAHELRSPLTSISGFSELLLDPPASREQSEEYAAIILKESNRLSELINKFLDISKIEAGKSQVHKSPVDLKFLVEKVLDFNSQLAQKKHIKVTLQTPPSISTINVDCDMMEQVILNLYSNAVKYSPENAHVFVRIKDNENDLSVEFEDTGFGISEKSVARIFDKFYRASDNEKVRDITGSGLGLSLVKEIIEIHGGKVQVRSRLGEGSTFTVTLPKTNGMALEQTDEYMVNLSPN